jgi:sigma-B regulation protein RsbU (phosphoserine phosphatase)
LQDLNTTLQDRIVADEEVAAFREQFIAVLGHDLRNPVAAVDAGVRMLLRDGLTEKTPRILRLMLGSVVRMNGLIDNVMDLARSRLGGGISLQIEAERQLRPTLEQVVDEIRAAHPDREILAHFDVDGYVAVDHLRIAQMFSNLLGNAMAHGAEDLPVQIDCTLRAGRLSISVANGGVPIPPEMLGTCSSRFGVAMFGTISKVLAWGCTSRRRSLARTEGGSSSRQMPTKRDLPSRYRPMTPTSDPREEEASVRH